MYVTESLNYVKSLSRIPPCSPLNTASVAKLKKLNNIETCTIATCHMPLAYQGSVTRVSLIVFSRSSWVESNKLRRCVLFIVLFWGSMTSQGLKATVQSVRGRQHHRNTHGWAASPGVCCCWILPWQSIHGHASILHPSTHPLIYPLVPCDSLRVWIPCDAMMNIIINSKLNRQIFWEDIGLCCSPDVGRQYGT